MKRPEDHFVAEAPKVGEGLAMTPTPEIPPWATPEERELLENCHVASPPLSPEASRDFLRALTTDSERPLDPKLVELYREVERFVQNGSRWD